LDELAQAGMSWSGHERNCVFLNAIGTRFANISAVSGFDFPDDGRSLGLVDWDHDGDLDLWAANRTGPRLRFLRNDATSGQHFVAFRLRGRLGNRDAIGARLELQVNDTRGKRRLIKSLRAGEGFLGQSTKWIHFGLGTATSVDELTVHWPGGARERFDVAAIDTHYQVEEGRGELAAWTRPERHEPPSRIATATPAADGPVHVLLPTRMALPTLRYTTLAGNGRELSQHTGQPVLLNLWASWCPPCVAELAEFARRHDELRALGVHLIALSVDGLNDDHEFDVQSLRAMTEELGLDFQIGVAPAELVETLQIYHDQLFKPHRALPLPTSVLIDAQGRLASFYKGPVTVDVLAQHARWLDESGPPLLDAALPFPGRWVTAPRALQMLPLAAELIDHDLVDAANELADSTQAQLHREPGFPQLLYRLGRQSLEEQDVASALDRFHQALQIKPGDADGFYNLAIAQAAQGNTDSTIELYQRAIAIDNSHAKAINNLGNIYVARNELDRAEQLYRRALEANPQLAEVHFNLGLVCLSQKKPGEAASCFREAIRIDPGHAAAHNNLGIILAQQNELAAATEHYRQAVQLDPEYAAAHNNLANALAVHGELVSAVEHYRQAIALDRQLVDAHDNLGRVLLAIHQPAAGIESLTNAARLQPDRAATTSLLAWLLATHPDERLRRPQQAVSWARRAVESTGRRDVRALDVLAAALASAGQFAEAIRVADEAIGLLEATDRSDQSAPIRRRRDGYRRQQPFVLRPADPGDGNR
jgi:Tfp pilus assembly protein PilF/peroxiredoxin